jgi:microcin C transport system substrate-binding protein
MRYKHLMLRLLCCLLLILGISLQPALAAEPRWKNTLTLFGTPKYKPWFHHFDYVNPKAPKGGTVKLMTASTFDSLNSYILKGIKAPGMSMLYETLMTSSLDEPQSYYPLVAEAYRLDETGRWIEFRINPKARWHDGVPITAEDVVWSLETLKKEGDPIYRLSFAPLKKAKLKAKNIVRFVFAKPVQREAPLMAASLPILPKHYYTHSHSDVTAKTEQGSARSGRGLGGQAPQPHEVPKVTFNKTTLTPPLGSGPYRVKTVDAGRSISFERVENYWGRDLPVNRGRHNFGVIRYDVYRDATVALEALKAGEYDLRQENIARNWATAYDIPALREGRLHKEDIPNEIPQGMQAFFYNLRNPILQDRRVRKAIALTMDFEWINKTLFYNAYKRNLSFFQFTPFAATNQLPGPKERALLKPYKKILPPEIYHQIFELPKTDGSGQNRTNLLIAQKLLDEAGIPLVEGRRINPHTGEPLRIEFLLNQATMQRVILPMRKGLKQLGIDGTLRIVDDAQYQRRLETFDYDIISNWINLGVFFPGVEQMNFWHSSAAEVEGSNNLSGMKNPAVDAMLEAINNAHTLEDLIPPARALDRILMWEYIVIPHWYNSTTRVAYWDKLAKPAIDPKYGFNFDAWWVKPGR